MRLKLFVIGLFVSVLGFSQVRIVEAGGSRKGIAYVACVSEKGYMIGITDANGNLSLQNISNVDGEDMVEFSHVSFESKRVKFKEFGNGKEIEMVEKVNELEAVTLDVSKKQEDYLVVRGFYRSYQVKNNIPVAFADGVAEYYIDNKKGKIYQNVVYQRKYEHKNKDFIEKKLNSSKIISITTGSEVGPLWFNVISDSDENKIKMTNEFEGIVINGNDTIGKVKIDELTKDVLINYDRATEKRPIVHKFLGVKVEYKAMSCQEKYYGVGDVWNKKSHLLSKKEYSKCVTSYKNKDKLAVVDEMYEEFYILGMEYISKEEFKKRKKVKTFGYKVDCEESQFLKEIAGDKIPEQQEYITRLLEGEFERVRK